MHIRHIAILKDYTEVRELLVEILYHLPGHVSLEIEHLREPDAVDEVSDALIDLSIEQLIKATSTQAIHEVLHFLLLPWHSKGEVEIHTDVSIIFCGTVVYLKINHIYEYY